MQEIAKLKEDHRRLNDEILSLKLQNLKLKYIIKKIMGVFL